MKKPWQQNRPPQYVKKDAVLRLILINVGIFLALFVVGSLLGLSQATSGFTPALTEQLRLSAPVQDLIRRPWSLLTYSFMHRDGWHLLWNMLTLFWFGSLLEDLIGSRKVTNTYILGGIFSALIYVLFHNVVGLATPPLSIRNVSPIIEGASAAVMAVMFATITIAPNYEFYFFRTFLIKIKYVAWFVLVISLLNLSSGVSHAAGALFGFIYIRMLQGGLDLGAPLDRFFDWWSRGRRPPSPPPARRYTATTVYSSTTTAAKSRSDEAYFPDQDEVDAILDKIGKSGYDSLTKEEKNTLYRASQRKD